MNSKYLRLSETERVGSTWNNLPTLSSSTRPCYITIIRATLVFSVVETFEGINLLCNVPSLNYFASSNNAPLCANLTSTDKTLYELTMTNEIHLLTNDNLKRIEFILQDNNGSAVAIDEADSLEVLIKIDYFDQEEMTDKVLSEQVKRL